MPDLYETQVKIKIIKHLKKNYPGIWYWKISDKFYSGIPDLLVIYKGRHIFFELKTVKGKATKLQLYTIEQIRQAGGEAYVVRTPKEVDQVLSS